MTVRIRVASAEDLPACQSIWAGSPAPDPAPEPNPLHRHELETGTLVVAEVDRPSRHDERPRVIGFGAALCRSGRWFLADLYVEASDQSSGVGRRLLDELARDAPTDRCCIASEDVRGQSLYAQAGMAPRWPIYDLRATLPLPRRLPLPWLRAEPAQPDDPEMAAFDAELVGVDRRVDLAWLCGPVGAQPLWLIDETGARQGYALVQRSNRAVLDPAWRTAANIVGVGVRRSSVAVDAVVATIGWASAAGLPAVRLQVPGPHPALPDLLRSGLRIHDHAIYCASSDRLFDPERRLPSLAVL